MTIPNVGSYGDRFLWRFFERCTAATVAGYATIADLERVEVIGV